MKLLRPVCFSILGLVACTAQPSLPPTSGAVPTPTGYVAGSAGNTTTVFDGTYRPGPVQNISKNAALPGPG